MKYEGIVETTYCREGYTKAGYCALFNAEGDTSQLTGVGRSYLTKAVLSPRSEEARHLSELGISRHQIQAAHQEFCYKEVRQSISGREFPESTTEDFVATGMIRVDPSSPNPHYTATVVGEPTNPRTIGKIQERTQYCFYAPMPSF